MSSIPFPYERGTAFETFDRIGDSYAKLGYRVFFGLRLEKKCPQLYFLTSVYAGVAQR